MSERQNIRDHYGDDFMEMIDTLLNKEMEKYSAIDFYDDLHEKFECNITQKLPEMQSLLNKLDYDVSELEKESRVLDDDIEKLKEVMTPVVDVKSPPIYLSPTDRSQAFTKSSHHTQDTGEGSSGQRLTRLEELRKFIRSGKISAAALYSGASVLGLCKDEWKEGIIEEVQQNKDKSKYKVRFTKSKRKSFLQLNHLACIESRLLFPNGEIPVGSRVAASFKEEGIYSGVIAESADRRANRSRYLIFYDDGYAMYCSPSCVYLVYGSFENVWDEISQRDTAIFVRDYLSTSERQLLSLKEGQTLKVEFEGVWHKARCTKVDCSLVEIHYFSDNSTEWIYRGSRRLEPLHVQQQMNNRTERPNKIARAHTGMRRAHIEFVDLTEDTGTSSSKSSASYPIERKDQWIAPWARSLTEQKANTLHSAPTRIPNSFTELQGGYDVASQIQNRFDQKHHHRLSHAAESNKAMFRTKPRNRSAGDRMEEYAEGDDGVDVDMLPLEISKHSAPYIAHSCSTNCVSAFSPKKLVGINPLTKPLLCGWTREICRIKPGTHRTSFHVYYRAPCGRACRSMADIDRYLRETGLVCLDYDHFCFDHTVRTVIGSCSNIARVRRPRDAKLFIHDYSDGKEDVPISCVNEINSEKPPVMPYSKTRVPGKGVQINTDPGFMVCCDCTDNCRDRSKCPCQQLTVQATSCSRGSKIKKEAGYQYKRLYSFLPTGIYECNSRCKCNTQCLNRVVQKGLQCRLQMFKTQKKGWGIRCLDDIPRGSFVCIYTGRIETEANANIEGLLNGDEYLAELDHIEVAENQKEDYNTDNSSGFESNSDETDDDESIEKLRRSSSFSDADEEVTDESLERRIGAITVIGGQKRKLGYNIDTRFTPSPLPENVQRKGKTTVTRKPSRLMERSDSSSSSNQSRSVTASREEDTTDTDSDTDVAILTRVPMARKSTASRSNNKKVEIEPDDDEPEGTRRFFGSNTEGMYIIDAKQTGNLGRYLNHSCTPNLMVQNVFLDTHDLRFPWVAFFASSTIRAGTELTWDYNYEIGSVPDRVIHCFCGSTKCRKRLL